MPCGETRSEVVTRVRDYQRVATDTDKIRAPEFHSVVGGVKLVYSWTDLKGREYVRGVLIA